MLLIGITVGIILTLLAEKWEGVVPSPAAIGIGMLINAAVVSAGQKKPGVVINAFKANATRQLREDGLWSYSFSPWADKGSKRRLWNERSVARAIDYVLNGQGDDLPDFDE